MTVDHAARQAHRLDMALFFAAGGVFLFPAHHIRIRDDGERRCTCWDDRDEQPDSDKLCKSRGKHPLHENWQTESTTDPAILRQWWAADPDANIGIDLTKSRLMVVDVDVRDDGDGFDTLRALIQRLGHDLPFTWVVRTGSGGLHYWFSVPGNCDYPKLVKSLKVLGLGEHVDIQGDGKLVIAPGSWNLKGQYRFLGGEDGADPFDPETPDDLRAGPAVAPDDLIALLTRLTSLTPAGPSGPVMDTLLAKLAERMHLVRGPLTPAGHLPIRCFWSREAGYAAGHGEGSKSRTVLMGARPGSRVGGFHCFAASCTGTIDALLTAVRTDRQRFPDGPAWLAEADRALDDAGIEPLSTTCFPPRIQANSRQLRAVTDECLQIVQRTNRPPSLFARGTQLVRIIHTAEGVPVIRALEEAHLRNRLTAVIDFYRVSPRGKKVECTPPLEVVRAILALEEWLGLPVLHGITEVPTLRPDGSILDVPGYDAATHLVYVPSETCRVPPIPLAPSAAQRAAATALLTGPFVDFPFANAASRANALAALETPLVRPVIASPVPMTLFDKPRMGTGASLLTEVISIVTTGRAAATLSAPVGGPHAQDEWRKLLTATLLDGPTIIVIDNIEGELRSAALAKAISGTRWKDRVLGVSQDVELAIYASWYATGNNVRLAGDLPRRVYWSRLASLEAKPWTRNPKTFRHPDLLAYVTTHRGDLIAAGLTLARAWFADGCPIDSPPCLGGFQPWVNVLHGILGTAGVEGFLANQDEVFAELDQEGPAWTAFITAWFAEFGATPQRVSDVVKMLTNNPDDALRAALPSTLVDALERERGFAQRLGVELQKRRDQVFLNDARQLRLEKAAHDKHTDVARWVVHPVERPAQSSHFSAGDAGTAGTSRTGTTRPPPRDHGEEGVFTGKNDANSSGESPRSPRAHDRRHDVEGDAEGVQRLDGGGPLSGPPREPPRIPCPACGRANWMAVDGGWVCPGCSGGSREPGEDDDEETEWSR